MFSTHIYDKACQDTVQENKNYSCSREQDQLCM